LGGRHLVQSPSHILSGLKANAGGEGGVPDLPRLFFLQRALLAVDSAACPTGFANVGSPFRCPEKLES
jgi:hypothetical protein